MNERWAVVYSFTISEDIRPFQGCYLVIGETKSFIQIQIVKVNRDGTEIEKRRVKKSNVVAYFTQDVSALVDDANAEVFASYKNHVLLKNKKVTMMKIEGLSEAA